MSGEDEKEKKSARNKETREGPQTRGRLEEEENTRKTVDRTSPNQENKIKKSKGTHRKSRKRRSWDVSSKTVAKQMKTRKRNGEIAKEK